MNLRSRLFTFAVLSALALSRLSPAAAEELTPELRKQFAAAELMFCFQGKGSCLPYDAGILQEAYNRLPALKQNRVVLGGNSSGSIAAAYLSCAGFSDATVRHAVQTLLEGDRSAVRDMENPNSKMSKMLRGKRTEIGHDTLRGYLGFALDVPEWETITSVDEVIRRSTAKPQLPLLIVSCNKEVIEDADSSNGKSAGRYKEFDPETLTVSWRKEVYEFYKQHPDRFAAEHPDLILGDDRRIGHAVTYFVDPSLYALLSQIPAEERQADLRLIDDAAGVAAAIMASVSEPTYFDPLVEKEPQKVLSFGERGDLGNVRRRLYYGGYIVATPAQDVRRMLPGLHVFGTGFRHFPLMSRSLMRNWLLVDIEPVAQRTEWWIDLETFPAPEMESHMDFRDLTAHQEYEFGLQRVRECFAKKELGLPMFVARPKFDYAAANAIMPSFKVDDMYEGAVQSSPGSKAGEPRKLKSNRGLDALLSRE